MRAPRPHDLLWLRHSSALATIQESWVSPFWHPDMPVVVRRDRHESGLIPIGVRGERREQRAAGWITSDTIIRVVTPEWLAERTRLLDSPFTAYAPVSAAISLSETAWPWRWALPAAPVMRWQRNALCCTPPAIWMSSSARPSRCHAMRCNAGRQRPTR